MSDITRDEYEARHLKLETDIIRLETNISVQLQELRNHLNQQDIIIAKQSSNFYKYAFTVMSGILMGIIPYLLHLMGIVK